MVWGCGGVGVESRNVRYRQTCCTMGFKLCRAAVMHRIYKVKYSPERSRAACFIVGDKAERIAINQCRTHQGLCLNEAA